jgi:hypothetical protein
MMILLLDFYLGKQTKITLKFIFITLLVKMRLSSCIRQDKKAMSEPLMVYTPFV